MSVQVGEVYFNKESNNYFLILKAEFREPIFTLVWCVEDDSLKFQEFSYEASKLFFENEKECEYINRYEDVLRESFNTLKDKVFLKSVFLKDKDR